MVRYRSMLGRRRVATMMVKVPYSGLFAMTEVLARAMSQRSISWYRVEVPPVVTPEMRAGLQRWTDALAESSLVTGVNWSA